MNQLTGVNLKKHRRKEVKGGRMRNTDASYIKSKNLLRGFLFSTKLNDKWITLKAKKSQV